MADIRINSLPSTATSFNTDDYIAIDGASGGTRKMLAATLPLTDVTLGGASGPSVKSSLSARAPRQGLVFDGTAGASATLGSAIGSGNTTYHVNFLCPSSAGIAGIIAVGDFSIQDSLVIQLDGSDRLALVLYAGGGQYSSYYIPSFTATYGGKRVTVSFTRNGTTINGFVNGISVSLTANNSGTPPVWNTSITTTSVLLGKLQSAAYYLNGVIYNALIYNRALSASEVVSLYEAGAPAGADYNSASNTSIAVAATNGNFGGFSSTATSITATSTGGTGYCYIPIPLVKGYKYRIQFTSAVAYSGNSLVWRFLGDPGSGSISGTWSNAVNCTPNAGFLQITSTSAASAEFTPDSSDSTAFLHLWEVGITAGSNVSQSGISVTRLGLLLAPDAAQAGGGLTWYDTSGNAANITLPASGVSWNVPTSASFAGGWSFGSGGGNVGIGLTNPTAGQLHVQGNSDAASGPNRPRIAITNQAGTAQTWTIQSWQSSGDANLSIYRTAAAGGILLASTGGRVGVGVTSFSGSGALELATHTTSAGGIGFGTDTPLYRSAANVLTLGTNTANIPIFTIDSSAQTGQQALLVLKSSAQAWDIRNDGTNLLIRDQTAGTFPVQIAATTGNATFAGTVTAQQLNALDAAANNRSAAIIRAQNNTTYSSSVLSVQGDRTTTNSTYNLILAQNAAVTGQFIVRDSGNVVNTNNSYGAVSDRKLKENIVDTAPKLAEIAKIQIRDYNLIGKTETQTGVIAQELETVFPSLVESFTDRDAEGNDLGTVTKTVKYSQLVPLLVKALQELRIDFETYKAAHP